MDRLEHETVILPIIDDIVESRIWDRICKEPGKRRSEKQVELIFYPVPFKREGPYQAKEIILVL